MPRVAWPLPGWRTLLPAVLLALCPSLRAQTVEDHLLMPKGDLCTGFVYMHDRWDEYWEGALKRDNQSIGSITTRSVSWMGNYGVTDRLNLIAMAPYVWTSASAPPLASQSGVQDLTLAAKYHLLETAFTKQATLRAIVVGSVGTPLGDYTPDFLPLSIGLDHSRAAARLTLNLRTTGGLFLNATGAHTWRGHVTLDRPAYFTDGRLYLSDQVDMPNVFDYAVSVGFERGGLHFPISFVGQRTRGGGDIRRQDMPFVSNRMNFSKLDATAMYYLPWRKEVGLRLGAAYTLDGRNVGQSTAFVAGILYTFHF